LNIQTQSKAITYKACITQMYYFILLMELDILLLTVMAYGCTVAISLPLHYSVIMNPCLCVLHVLVSQIINFLISKLHTSMLLLLSFCDDLEITVKCNNLSDIAITLMLNPFVHSPRNNDKRLWKDHLRNKL
jgi:olfactory receptor